MPLGPLQCLLDAIPDAIVVSAPDGRILSANAQAQALFGYARDELCGQPVELLVPEARRLEHARLRGAYASDATARSMAPGRELVARARDGREIPVEIRLGPLETEAGPAIIAIVRDLTERRAQERALASVEAQLYQAQKIDAIGQLAGGVAHDFNNLLVVVMSYADSLLAEVGQGTVREDLIEIRRAAERGAELTKQLLAFGRRQVAQPRRLDLNRVVRELRRMLHRLLSEELELELLLAEDLFAIHADAGQIQQVIVNLVLNARDAMPRGGTIVVETRNDRDAAGADQVLLCVRDHGTGIPLEIRARIFEPFFSTKGAAGTGLGLATVHGIVHQCGGSIRCDSVVGEGTSFLVAFPRTEAANQSSQRIRLGPDGEYAGGSTILLVDDEALVRQAVSRILRSGGYEVLECEGGSAALEHARSGAPIHLLLSDVVMPGLSGPALAGQIQALRPGLPVLFMSGYPGEALLSPGDIGLEIVQKPFRPRELLRLVSSALQRRAS